MNFCNIKKLYVFDIDNTLCESNKGMNSKTIELLKELQANNSAIVFASGKPAAYIAGFIRQSGLKNVWIIGENGYETQFSHTYPPKIHFKLRLKRSEIETMNSVSREILFRTRDYKRGSFWLQPNRFNFGYFLKDNYYKNHLNKILNDVLNENSDNLLFYYHDYDNCFDLTHNKITKANALNIIRKKYIKNIDEITAFGDSKNDIPMFNISNHSIRIGSDRNIEDFIDISFNDINDALNYIIKRLHT